MHPEQEVATRVLYAVLTGLALLSSESAAGAGWTSHGPDARINALATDPATPGTVYAGTEGGEVFKSTNAGSSWTAVDNGLTDSPVKALVIDPTTSGTLYAGTFFDGGPPGRGVFKTTDGGTTWSTVNGGLTNLSVRALAIDPATPTRLYAGTDGGGMFRSTNAGADWSPVNSGLSTLFVRSLAIDPKTPTTLYAGTSASFTGVGGGVFKSANEGVTWSSIGLTGRNILALAIDPETPSRLYAAGPSGVFKSTDGGTTWNDASTGLTERYSVALAIDPGDPDTLFVGTDGGGVSQSTNAATSWSADNAGLTNLRVWALAIDAVSTLYAGTFAGVFQLARVPEPPAGPSLSSAAIPGFRFKVRITSGDQVLAGVGEADCIGETLCVSGALPGRSELFVRIIGPRPNGFLWINLVRFTTSQVEVWAERVSTGKVNYYRMPALPRDGTELTGLVDKEAFLPTSSRASEDAGLRARTSVDAEVIEYGSGQAAVLGLPPLPGRLGLPVVFTPPAFPGFQFTVRIFSGGVEQPARLEADCIAETACVSGAVPGRSELFLRLIGPRPNGFLWTNLVRFTTSRVEVEVRQLATGVTRSYVLAEVPRDSDALPGLVDKEAFVP
jgi:photosystem II stability/assembly factor-like uncharacterized protein